MATSREKTKSTKKPLAALKAAEKKDDGGALAAEIEARLKELIAAKVKPRHNADHWVPATDTIVELVARKPGVLVCPETSEEGLAVGRRLADAARPFVTRESRMVFTDEEQKLIEAAAREVASIRRELDAAARTPDERRVARTYGVGGVAPSSSPKACRRALATIVTTYPKNKALWTTAGLGESDLEKVTTYEEAVGAIVDAKKPRMLARKGKSISGERATLALEIWCDRLLAAARRRLEDGTELKGQLLAAARPDQQRRRDDGSRTGGASGGGGKPA